MLYTTGREKRNGHASVRRVRQNRPVTTVQPYLPRVAGQRRELSLRGARYSVTEWGDEGAPLIVYLHGWGDVGATFQFVVDAFRDDWRVVAPDWRGFGDSTVECSSYWFPDYLADLHEMLEVYSPDAAARIVGHSMGANVAGLYAGTMPERVSAFINIEGLGLADAEAGDAPARYRDWILAARAPTAFSTYEDFAALAMKIGRRHPRMSAAQAEYVARAWARQRSDGRVELRADPRHRLPNPVLYRRAEALACWHRIKADVLLVEGTDSDIAARHAGFSEESWPAGERRIIDGAGHMLHFEAPAALACVIEDFLRPYL